jgi:hypothetical protein
MIRDNNDCLKTTVVGHREARYRGEPLSRREILRLDEKLPLRSVGEDHQSITPYIDEEYARSIC